MTEKTTKTGEPEVETQATRGAALAPQCPAVGTNQTFQLVRRRKIRYQRKQTYHYHHAP
jgi:hypothetical protein